MSRSNNIEPVNLDTINDSGQYFSNIFNQTINVSLAVDQAVLAFFEKRSGDINAAKSMASALILSSLDKGLDPMEVLDRIRNVDTLDVDIYTAMVLNLSRVNTSVLGVINKPPVSEYITRSILA